LDVARISIEVIGKGMAGATCTLAFFFLSLEGSIGAIGDSSATLFPFLDLPPSSSMKVEWVEDHSGGR
jgi:hypothetical protein